MFYTKIQLCFNSTDTAIGKVLFSVFALGSTSDVLDRMGASCALLFLLYHRLWEVLQIMFSHLWRALC